MLVYIYRRINNSLPRGLYRPQRPHGVRGYVYVAIEQLDDTGDNVLYIGVRLSTR